MKAARDTCRKLCEGKEEKIRVKGDVYVGKTKGKLKKRGLRIGLFTARTLKKETFLLWSFTRKEGRMASL